MPSMVKFALLALTASAATAKDIFITVGNITDGDLTTTFQPQRVDAVVGDTVWFNFTNGNHSATQSTFPVPCVPAHDTNITINGFDSGFRSTANGTAVTQLPIPILVQNVGAPFWFYDASPGACGAGAVGVINNDESGNETLAGFMRNAERLNGTDASSSTSTGSFTATHSTLSSSPTSQSAAQRVFALSGSAALAAPLTVLAFALSLL